MVDICRYLDIVAAFCQVFGFEVDRAHYPEATGDSWMVRVGHSVMCSQYSAIIKLPAINTSHSAGLGTLRNNGADLAV